MDYRIGMIFQAHPDLVPLEIWDIINQFLLFEKLRIKILGIPLIRIMEEQRLLQIRIEDDKPVLEDGCLRTILPFSWFKHMEYPWGGSKWNTKGLPIDRIKKLDI